MKRILMAAVLFSAFFTACNEDKKIEKEERKISKRNYEITPENAYNDLFLDSMAVEKYIREHSLPDSVSRRMISFYNTRNYEYAWFSSTGITEQTSGFTSLLNFTKDTSDSIKKIKRLVDGLMMEKNAKITRKNEKIRNAELALTQELISYMKENFEKGYIPRREVEHFVPFVKEEPLALADSLLRSMDKEKKDFSEVSEQFRLLAGELRRYVDIANKGSWKKVEEDKKAFRKGGISPAIVAAKMNLHLSGDLPVADSSAYFDSSLEQGIRSFQTRHGVTADGKASDWFFKEINVTPIQRVKQILVNMNRMRWLPNRPDGRLIMVNTPAFTLDVLEDGNKVFSMPVVVGKEGHNTTIFSDMLSTIVFSPYWNIPRSIVEKEVLPAMDTNPEYLEEHNMEIVKEVDGLPQVRQKPGPGNSLGKVKFLFPNSFNIYFHDTPAKSLFNKDVRAYSHGCIRLADPEKLANYLLDDNNTWTPEKIEKAMNSGEEQYVKLKDAVPVFITYYTAWVTPDKILHLRDDIYGHDREVEQKMFF